MSFLGDLVNSIGSGKAPAPQPKPFQRQATPSTATSKPAVKAAQLSTSNVPPANLLKRKADEQDARTTERSLKVNPPSILQTKSDSRPSTPLTNGIKVAPPMIASLPATPSTAVSAKLPPKGSYADIMARAKQAQEQQSSKVGLIKHQATSKEKVSKVAERRREEQERLKNEKSKSSQRPVSGDRMNKRRSVSPAKKGDQSKASKASRPLLHPPSTYKGTLGAGSKRARGPAADRPQKRSRYDEYLGTDEEDEDDIEDEDDGHGYASDQSSDMEANWDELEGEEASALAAARKDDARELAIETQKKNEKEERRRKLAAMAKRSR